jgi:hypothetical protein
MPQIPQGPKRREYRLTPEQEAILETEFQKVKTLHATDLALLAVEMGVDEDQVQVSTTTNEK